MSKVINNLIAQVNVANVPGDKKELCWSKIFPSKKYEKIEDKARPAPSHCLPCLKAKRGREVENKA